MQDKNTLDQLKNIISEREDKVKQLDKELRALKEMKSNDGFFIQAVKPQTPPSPVSFYNNNNNVDLDLTRNRPSSSSNSNNFTRNRSDSINEPNIDRNISSRFLVNFFFNS